MAKFYEAYVETGVKAPPPRGGETIANELRKPPYSSYGQEVAKDDEPVPNIHVPQEQEFGEAIKEISARAAELLAGYPEWEARFQEILVREFGAT
eukprot:8314465-Lingulodinium_polyedra.AAC.1